MSRLVDWVLWYINSLMSNPVYKFINQIHRIRMQIVCRYDFKQAQAHLFTNS